ncbi:MAG: 1-deoxy-D-xylulose-5-phosphate reductoisomerase [Thermoanaerobaculia bacterium]
MQRLAILGATGSIGESTATVVRQHPDRLSITTLAAHGRSPAALLALAREFRPQLVAILDEGVARDLRREMPAGVKLVSGPEALLAATTHPDVDKVVAAIVGAAGLPPVVAALSAGKSVALANKESLVVAGRLLTDLARAHGAEILPIDSEHAALHQALRCGARSEVRRLVLTASGGPFLRRDPATFASIRPEDALRHPTWAMGAKISVDSATLINKGLELIEASHLFGVGASAIDVVVHPRSIVHSLVEFHDGSWLAQMSANDMVFPIQYALAYPDRWANDFPRLDLAQLGTLEFLPLDEVRFPAVRMARAALAAGESAPAVLNAANEVAVHAFLAETIGYSDILPVIAEVLEAHSAEALADVEAALGWDAWARREAEVAVAALSKRQRPR